LMLDDLLSGYEKRGVRLISLKEALQDPVYQQNPNYANKQTWTFLSQTRIANKLKEPARIKQLLAEIPSKELQTICR
jgi:hypothetical protein